MKGYKGWRNFRESPKGEVRGSKVEFEVAFRGIGVGLYWAPDVYRALPRPDAPKPAILYIRTIIPDDMRIPTPASLAYRAGPVQTFTAP